MLAILSCVTTMSDNVLTHKKCRFENARPRMKHYSSKDCCQLRKVNPGTALKSDVVSTLDRHERHGQHIIFHQYRQTR